LQLRIVYAARRFTDRSTAMLAVRVVAGTAPIAGGESMEFLDRVMALATKVRQQKASIPTEEATKNAFVMPFISTVLGYDVFDPSEVIPEFNADVGIKKGEKIDYAIVKDDVIQILVECKKIGEALRPEHSSQLFRYFSVTNARIAVLTNGEVYQFFTDLDAPNKMDAKPFLVLDLSDVDPTLIPELHKLSKDTFDLESIISAAGQLKYIGQIKRVLTAQFKGPDEDWVRFLTTRIYEGSFTQRVREQFTPLVAKASTQFLNEQVNDRLATALGTTTPATMPDSAVPTSEPVALDDLDRAVEEITTTVEELEAFHIVRAIACSEVKPNRIVYRDSKSYCAILLDDNNRKTIARLNFNRRQKYLSLFDENKTEQRVSIESLDEIYDYSTEIRSAILRYSRGATSEPEVTVVSQI
jgi:hypothetical protein